MALNPVDLVGQLVTHEAVDRPHNARRLLEGAYTYVNVSGKLNLAPGIGPAAKRFNGAVAKSLVSSLTRPEEACIVNIFMPCELLHALDVTPMFPEGLSVYVSCTRCAEIFCTEAEAGGVPESFCSYHKLMMGLASTEVMPAPKMIANTTLACDANQVSFRSIARMHDIPQTVIDVPQGQTEADVAYVAGQLETLAGDLARRFGRPLDEERLAEICERGYETLQLMAAFTRNRAEKTLPQTLTGELLGMIGTHILLGTPEALAYAKEINEALAKAPDASESMLPRVFWMHTLPNWQDAMTGIFDGGAEGRGAELVGNDMASDAVHLLGELDPSKPYDFMARRLVKGTFNGSSSRRIEGALREARRAKADGIILFGHWGCKQTTGIASLTKSLAEEAGFPTLVLDGDGCDPRNASDGQMVTRVEAFLEQLSAS